MTDETIAAVADDDSRGVPAVSDTLRRYRRQDSVFRALTFLSAALVVLVLAGMIAFLINGALPALTAMGPSFFWSSNWDSNEDIYGALAPIFGTLTTAAIAMVIGIPVSFGIAMFLTEICPTPLRRPIGTAIELLAGIPSVVYGIWGLFYLTPVLQEYVQPVLIDYLGPLPIFGVLFQGPPFGIGILDAGIVLAIMVLPYITSITRDVFMTVPPLLRESAYGMGCTTAEVVGKIVIPYCRVGLIGGVMLGLGRALGETMAVTFVVGNTYQISASLLSPGTTISAAIANEFNEAFEELHLSALIALGLILFMITFTVLALAKWMLAALDKREGR